MVLGHPLFSTYSLAGWWEHWEHRNRKPLDRNHRRNPWFPIGSPIGRSLSQSIDPWISIKERLICEPIPIIHHFWDQESLSDWWFETCFMFPLYWECHHPNWRTHSIIFQRARLKPPTSNPWCFPTNGRRLRRLKSGQICGGCRERRCWLQCRCRALALTQRGRWYSHGWMGGLYILMVIPGY